jgi:hypothetical protein
LRTTCILLVDLLGVGIISTWKCATVSFLIHLIFYHCFLSLYQFCSFVYNQNLFSRTKWSVPQQAPSKFNFCFPTLASLTKHSFVNPIILPPSVVQVVHFCPHVCDSAVIFLLYHLVINTLLACHLQCARPCLKQGGGVS